ncbi:MAG: response regulator [Planctomycetota bacterium]|nr:MAG: response regulator [Planctomycetota bacterium]
MTKNKDVLTTGQVAKICNVAPRTVSKWFDNGQLRGYRIPGSKDRRIPLQQLIRFMKAHKIPMDGLEIRHTRILIVDTETELSNLIQKALTENGDYEVQVARSVFEAGMLTEQFHPNIILVDMDLPGIDAALLRQCLCSHAELQEIRLIGMSASMTKTDRQTLLQHNYHDTLSKPFTIGQLTQVIETTIGSQSQTIH